MTLTKIKLAESLVEMLGINKSMAIALVKTFFGEMRCILERGQQLRLGGFGNFNLRDKRERPGRNPKTGKDFPIAPRRVVTFKAGQKLKARIESNIGTTMTAKAKSLG